MSRQYIATSEQLSSAWAELFLELMKPGVTKLSPVVVTVSEFDANHLPVENPAIRAALDRLLETEQNCRTVASTIFPNSVWRTGLADNAADLYARYEKIWPRIKKCHPNANGVYFRRLTAYRPKCANGAEAPVNQLGHIIETYRRGNHRHSALQASILDPTRDHNHARQRGFPCLQQVAFGAVDGELEVTGFYALQHHITKSYGNYLGLCWLGRFMAQQMELRLSRVTCISSMLNLGAYTKTALSPLKGEIEQILTVNEEQQA